MPQNTSQPVNGSNAPGDDVPGDAGTLDVRPAYRRAYETVLRKAKGALGQRFRLVRLARDAYRKTIDHEDTLGEIKDDLLALARLVGAWAAGDYRQVAPQTILSIVGAVLYFVSPIDAIPDFIPVVGLADDVAVIAAVVRSVRADLDRFRRWEAERARQDPPAAEKHDDPQQTAGMQATGDGAPPRLSA